MTTAIFPPVIDATMRSSFLLCPHHFFRRHCQGLTHDTPSVHLHFGACLAKGLEVTRSSYAGGMAQSAAVVEGANALLAQWGTFDYTPNTRTEANKTLENCLLALSDYFREWPLATDPIQIHYHNDKPCIEFSGAWPIPGMAHPETGEPIYYAGRFDMIGDYQSSVWGLDDKTTSSLGQNWRQQWMLRGQFTGYTWLASQFDMPLNGFAVRGIQILTNSTKCEMAITPRPKWMVERWLDQLCYDTNRMLECWDMYKTLANSGTSLAASWPQNLDSGCFSYMRPCEYMDLCSSPHPERWEWCFTIKHWNPLAREAQHNEG
jgi:hypothetical protein